MKKLFTLFLVFISFSSFAQKTKVDSLITKLSKKIAASQYFYHPQLYIEIAFIRDEYNVPNLLKDDSVLIKRLNDFYYKQFYPYGKLFNRNFQITEDCITSDENAKTLEAYKLLMYSLYDNFKLPDNYFKRLETSSKLDDPFMSEYYTLNTIYFLKKFRGSTLNPTQNAQLKALEEKLSNSLFTNYIENKPWSFYKLTAIKALKINKNPLVNNIDMTPVMDYYLQHGLPETNILDIDPVEEDIKNSFLKNNIGMDKVMQMEAISLLWIILIDKK